MEVGDLIGSDEFKVNHEGVMCTRLGIVMRMEGRNPRIKEVNRPPGESTFNADGNDGTRHVGQPSDWFVVETKAEREM